MIFVRVLGSFSRSRYVSVARTFQRPQRESLGVLLAAGTTSSCIVNNTATIIREGSIPERSRNYVSRAHPKPIPEFPVDRAIEDLLEDIQRRHLRRERVSRKWNGKNEPEVKPREEAEKPLSASSRKEGRYQDETIELALNLNLDPRKPGQALRGSIQLPCGTGKVVQFVVFTNDSNLAESAKAAGALYAGGETLIEEIASGDVPLSSFQRALATSEIMPTLSSKVARLLGPRGLMPNAKVGTLFSTPGELLEALQTQLAGADVVYRTDREGIVHVPVGKASFGQEKLLENIGEVMKEVFKVKPENYGKGKRSKKPTGKGAKYLLRASLSSTQGPGLRLDVRTVDPSSAFFLSSTENNRQNNKKQKQSQ